MQKCPLVSICVISYNSAATIVETLDSAAAQTYRNIELVVSDDGSRDDTLLIIERWVANNRGRFTDIKIVTVQKNTGITPNCNRAWRAASGEWIKMIAADDIMLPHMVQTYIEYAREHPEDKLLFSPLQLFGEDYISVEVRERYEDSYKLFGTLDGARKQYNELFLSNFVPAPSSFIGREVLERLNGFDKDIVMMEDLPFWVKATKNGLKLTIVGNQPLVKYRISANSIQSNNARFSTAFLLFRCKYYIFNPFYWLLRGAINQIYPDKLSSQFFRKLLYGTSILERAVVRIMLKIKGR